jgi:hypothetical protein
MDFHSWHQRKRSYLTLEWYEAYLLMASLVMSSHSERKAGVVGDRLGSMFFSFRLRWYTRWSLVPPWAHRSYSNRARSPGGKHLAGSSQQSEQTYSVTLDSNSLL